MAKKVLTYRDQVNFLTVEGTVTKLVAISYYRGEGGAFAGPARDMIDRGIREFIASLSPKERKRFEDIMENVRIMRADNPLD